MPAAVDHRSPASLIRQDKRSASSARPGPPILSVSTVVQLDQAPRAECQFWLTLFALLAPGGPGIAPGSDTAT